MGQQLTVRALERYVAHLAGKTPEVVQYELEDFVREQAEAMHIPEPPAMVAKATQTWTRVEQATQTEFFASKGTSS
eukprot:CAMPEP_0168494958 /NCGR_PEP_ID=MMETSP0228-20121227/71492_1 /TAXON_ID=133427 /ORGANISM="Protoceratium reticulatum, Strain CCCM 535 (=CCMP 1889)" /LENGTH=75 /DNA_ID=CAMNT_0008511767 /DNA_START=1 /DNA_END=225 /DNA_ORIENTATION=-